MAANICMRKLFTISSNAPHAAPDVGTLRHEAILIGGNFMTVRTS